MILRQAVPTLQRLAQGYPILAITRPRQSGKTTLAQSTFPDKPYVSLEDLDTRAFPQMGIADAGHLAIHSTRRALFENWVISELLKHRYNLGLASNLYFWRNNTGDEIDVVIEQGDKLQPVEIKSGQTYSADFLNGLNKWARYAGDAALPAQLVYGGDDTMLRNGVAVHSWRNLKGLLDL